MQILTWRGIKNFDARQQNKKFFDKIIKVGNEILLLALIAGEISIIYEFIKNY